MFFIKFFWRQSLFIHLGWKISFAVSYFTSTQNVNLRSCSMVFIEINELFQKSSWKSVFLHFNCWHEGEICDIRSRFDWQMCVGLPSTLSNLWLAISCLESPWNFSTYALEIAFLCCFCWSVLKASILGLLGWTIFRVSSLKKHYIMFLLLLLLLLLYSVEDKHSRFISSKQLVAIRWLLFLSL